MPTYLVDASHQLQSVSWEEKKCQKNYICLSYYLDIFWNIHHRFVCWILLNIHFFLLNLHLEVDVEMDFKKCFLETNYVLLQVYIANY